MDTNVKLEEYDCYDEDLQTTSLDEIEGDLDLPDLSRDFQYE